MINMELENYFTNDAWEIILNYLKILQNKLREFNVKDKDIIAIYTGINEFLTEYYLENQGKHRINFQTTLKLIEELGSPLEIIQNLDLEKPGLKSGPISTTDTEPCSYCMWINNQTDKYCQNCGKNLSSDYIPPFQEVVKQTVYDSPYSITFLLTFFVLTVINSIWEYIFGDYIIDIPHPLYIIIISAFKMLIPSFIIAILLGWLLDKLFEDKKSFKYKYNKELNSFEEWYAIGWLLIFFGTAFLVIFLWIVWTPIPEQTSAFFILLTILLGSFVGIHVISYIWVISNQYRRPKTLSFGTLINSKRIVYKSSMKKLTNLNMKIGIPIFFVYTAIVLGILSFDAEAISISTPNKIFFILITLILILLEINGIFIMRISSWFSILDILEQYNQKGPDNELNSTYNRNKLKTPVK